MAVKVVDASAVAAILFGEPEGQAVAARLMGGRLLAPALLAFEVANIALKKMRRHPDHRDALIAAHVLLDRMGIDVVDVDLADVLLLAERSGLTVYDAAYLWLARRMGAELVTLDRELQAAFIGPAT
ncbi:type II toxin-antitoxin system VapC family toxin [Azospirillum sp. A39]|uniref:type II toxin-antitoxin system VapC family toxin n=1 Tax=Azospirillum sp. A39 TaxID=3462279 RepID=UPI0040458736